MDRNDIEEIKAELKEKFCGKGGCSEEVIEKDWHKFLMFKIGKKDDEKN
ncbi:MAG: hypothetical protein QF907_03780 [Nitrospinota bacterium]|jgi:hypothetical protein|nr:hypothetical protein [Nitrospinota bacterium]|tara:strand:- start:188 stop:334 length:147 start_codon:yes stop_codon:yes gene_type:complete